MFGFIKLLLLLAMLAFGFFAYDFYTHLNDHNRNELKAHNKALFDSGDFGNYLNVLGSKMNKDFSERFWPKVLRASKAFNEDVPK